MENLFLIIALTFGLIILFLAAGTWISVALGTVGIVLIMLFFDSNMLKILGALQYNSVNSFTWVSLPLFIFMGEIIKTSGIGERLYRGASPWVSRLPGGLLHTNIVACAIFSACSGSSMATAATIGTVAIPELKSRGYDKKILFGSLAAGGTLGIMIPPSLGLIIYGVFVDESIGRLFMAGVFPGITMSLLFMLYIAISAMVTSGKNPKIKAPTLKEIGYSLFDVFPVLFLVATVLGTIYFGIATPSEAAALGVSVSLIICGLYRKLTLDAIKMAGINAVNTTAWLLMIVIGATLLSASLAYLEVPATLATFIAEMKLNRYFVLILIGLLYLVLGMFMEGTSMSLLTLPVVYPMITDLALLRIGLQKD